MAIENGQIRPPNFATMVGIIAGISVLVLLSSTVVIVSAGERAVIFDKVRGVLPETRGEGITFVVPFIQHAIHYDVKTQTYSLGGDSSDGSATTGENAIEGLTKDGQKVNVDISVRFKPQEDNVWKLHQQVGPEYMSKIVIPDVRSSIRTVIAEYNVLDVYSHKRRDIQDKMTNELQRTFKKYYLELNEVLIRNVRFSEEFQKAIEAKQVAQQDAQRMEYVLQKEKQEKQRKIIEAEGEAKSISIRGSALTANPRLIQYEYIQKLTPTIKAVITDQKSILNFANLFDPEKK